MNVRELKAILDDMPNDMDIMIGGQNITGTVRCRGRVKRDLMGDRFVQVAESKARDEVLMFSRLTELADGHMYEVSL